MAESSSSEGTVIAQFRVHKAKGESMESDKEDCTCTRYTYTLSLSSSGSDSELQKMGKRNYAPKRFYVLEVMCYPMHAHCCHN